MNKKIYSIIIVAAIASVAMAGLFLMVRLGPSVEIEMSLPDMDGRATAKRVVQKEHIEIGSLFEKGTGSVGNLTNGVWLRFRGSDFSNIATQNVRLA
ncbi:MAG: hypothetical protein KAI74_06865, partial [Kiritimatiellae bacterium]|nr:hypothetical protein [Kiritimatiellia bacterium]